MYDSGAYISFTTNGGGQTTGFKLEYQCYHPTTHGRLTLTVHLQAVLKNFSLIITIHAIQVITTFHLPKIKITRLKILTKHISDSDISSKKNAYALKTPHVVFLPVIFLSYFFGMSIDKLQGSQKSMETSH